MPLDIAHQPAFQYWLFSLVALFVKMLANSVVQGVERVSKHAFVNPEDARFWGRGAAPFEVELPMVQRAAACWRNDLENIPLYLFLGLAFVLAGGSAGWAAVYFGTFTVARVAHTACYLGAVQPWRTIAHNVGLAVCLALAVHECLLLGRG